MAESTQEPLVQRGFRPRWDRDAWRAGGLGRRALVLVLPVGGILFINLGLWFRVDATLRIFLVAFGVQMTILTGRMVRRFGFLKAVQKIEERG